MQLQSSWIHLVSSIIQLLSSPNAYGVLESFLIQLEGFLIQLESSLIQLESSRIQLKRSLISQRALYLIED